MFSSNQPLIDKYKYDQEEALIQYNGKILIVRFDKVFQVSDELNKFFIIKDLFVNKLSLICKYLNYFIEYYDQDMELVTSYLKIKYLVDNKAKFKKISQKGFIDAIYSILFTPSMIEKIKTMVEDNYIVSLVSVEESNSNKYNKSLEFNDEHGKLLLMISTAIKMIIPLEAHYSNSRKIKKPDYFKCFEKLFTLFDKDINIYNKLYLTIHTRLMRDYNANKIIWNQKEMIDGADPATFIDTILKDRIVVDNLFKYKFDQSVHSFNISIINYQLKYFKKDKYDFSPKEISHSKDDGELSSIDKFVMNMDKTDESLSIISEINIKTVMKKIRKRFNIYVEPEELNYYVEHMVLNNFLKNISLSYYAKFFQGYNDLNNISKELTIELIVILKKKLIYDGQVFLPQLLTANLQSKLNSRVIQNNKFISRLEASSLYQKLITEEFSAITEVKGNNVIITTLSTLINTNFTFVDYEMPDRLGETIDINQNNLTDEFLKFLSEF